MFHHKSIKRFSIKGTIHDEAKIACLKEEYISLLIAQMRDDGYALRSDIDYDFTISYMGPDEGFAFLLSVYGVYVGKRKSQRIDHLFGYKAYYIKQVDKKEVTK